MASTESNIHPDLSQLSTTQLVDKIQELIDSGKYYKIQFDLRNECNGRCYLGLVYEALVQLELARWENDLDHYPLLGDTFRNLGTPGYSVNTLDKLWKSNDIENRTYQQTHDLLKALLLNSHS